MPDLTYTGPFPRGEVRTADRLVPFTKGTTVEFTDDEAKHLGDEWAGDTAPDTVAEIKKWVGDDPDRAQQALDAETARSKPRKTLVDFLTTIATPGDNNAQEG